MVLGNRVWSVLKFELFEKYGPVTGKEPINQRTRRIISNYSNFRKQNPRKKYQKNFYISNPRKVFILLPFKNCMAKRPNLSWWQNLRCCLRMIWLVIINPIPPQISKTSRSRDPRRIMLSISSPEFSIYPNVGWKYINFNGFLESFENELKMKVKPTVTITRCLYLYEYN